MPTPSRALISSVIKKPGVCVSYEFFPPKDREQLPKLYETVLELKAFHRPDFCSVTWGAGGSTVRNSIDVVSHLTHKLDLLTMAHFTGLGMTPGMVDEFLTRFEGTGIHNLLVLRGDRPHAKAGEAPAAAPPGTFKYASELVRYIRSKPDRDASQLSILVAGCPEGHPEAVSTEADWDQLASKVRMGAEGIVTQLFFDNQAFYRFQDGLKQRQVDVPVAVGVMIVTKAKMIQRIIELSRCSVPAELAAGIARFESDDASMEAFGIDFAARQVGELMGRGVRNFHFYTLNQAGPTTRLLAQLKDKLGAPVVSHARTVNIEYREYMAYPDSQISDLFKKYGLNPALPHSIVYNHALRRYEITQ